MKRNACPLLSLFLSLFLAAPSGASAQGTDPPTPTNLTAQAITGPTVQLDWEAPTGLWMYKVYRSVGTSTSFTHIGLPTINRRFYDNEVLPGQTYNYYVTSINQSLVESAPSNTTSATVPGEPSGGTITGTVTDEVTHAPIRNVQIQIFTVGSDPQTWMQVLTDQNGMYQAVVEAGRYTIHAIPPYPSGYQDEWFDNASDSQGAAQVEVTAGSTIVADMALAKKSSATTGKIAGRVVDEVTSAPISFVNVKFYRESSPQGFVAGVLTDGDGNYEATLAAGTYVIQAVPPAATGYTSEWFDDASDSASATPVEVTAGGTSTANFSLAGGVSPPPPGQTGKVAGTVIDDVTQQAIHGVRIIFYSKANVSPMRGIAVTNDAGYYEAVLDTGVYLLRAEPPIPSSWKQSYLGEWYDNVQKPEDATPVHVVQGTTVTANFGLTPIPEPTLAAVEGTVSDTLGNPLENAQVVVMRTIQDMNILGSTPGEIPGVGAESILIDGVGHCRGVIWRGWTDATGHYKATVVAGQKYIALAAKAGYAPEYFDNKTNPLAADVIHVDGDVTGIDFSLTPLPSLENSISGNVKDESGNGVPSRVVAIPENRLPLHRIARFSHTDAEGNFMIGGLAAGEYLVLAVPFSGYAPAFYKKDAFGIIHANDADIVQVDGDVTDINIGVVPILSIGPCRLAGRTTTSDGGGLEGVNVFVTSGSGDIVGYGLSEAGGNYTVEGMPGGSLTVAVDREGYSAANASVEIPAGAFEATADVVLTPEGTVGVETGARVPSTYSLNQNYPNPFNPSTTISFDMPVGGNVLLNVFNVLGQRVATLANGPVEAGVHAVTWNGRDVAGRQVATGLYLCRLTVTAGNGREVYSGIRKMLLTK